MRFPWQSDPVDAQAESNQYLNKIEPMLNQQYGYYTGAGQDPGQHVMNQQAQFQESPGYRFMMDNALKGARNSAAGAGMSGTYSDQMDQGDLAAMLQSKYMQDWVNNLNRVEDRGLSASNSYAGDMGNLFGTQGNMAYGAAQQKNSDSRAQGAALLQALLGGAGFALGGPAGASIGSGLGGAFGGSNASNMPNSGWQGFLKGGFASQPSSGQGYGFNNPNVQNLPNKYF